MRNHTKAMAAALAAIMGAPAYAACPPLANYSVSNVNADNVLLQEAVDAIFDSTAWHGTVVAEDNAVRVTLRDVSGPLDLVLDKLVKQARDASGTTITMRRDGNTCQVKLDVVALAPAPVSVPNLQLAGPAMPVIADSQLATASATADHPPATASVHGIPVTLPREVARLESGKFLSAALAAYAEQEGWKVRWLIPNDYMLDVDVLLPKRSFQENVVWLVETYQMQGGLLGIRPRFTSNRVFVMEPMRPDGDEK